MQSDVSLVGGTSPATSRPAVAATANISNQAGDKPPSALAVGQSQIRPVSTGQVAAVTEAKIALSANDAPTALSQAERVLKPYGVTMLPEPSAESAGEPTDAAEEDAPEEDTDPT